MIRFKTFKHIAIATLSCIVLFGATEGLAKPKKKTGAQTKSATASATKSKSSASTAKSKKSTSTKASQSKSEKLSGKAGTIARTIQDRLLHEGVQYRHVVMHGAEKKLHSVHIVTVQTSVEGNRLVVMKGKDRYNQLERLADMVPRIDSAVLQPHASTLLAAVNANFWRAYLNNPIGPTIINGQVVELPSYKLWSSMFFDQTGKPYLDRFIVSGVVRYPPQRVFAIESVNNRQSLPGVVLYNSFYGTTVPMNVFPTTEEIERELHANRPTDEDSTEHEIKRSDIEKMIFDRKQSASIEYGLPKVQIEFLDVPMVNREARAVVRQLRGDSISVPHNGAVISFGSNVPPEKIPARGDTIMLGFFTNKYRDIPMLNSISGTPRLVRDGNAEHEAYIEGSKSKRFIKQGLPRTAIGYSADGATMFLMGVDGVNTTLKTHGATLTDMAVLMKSIGAFQAMNLDGGGSSAMMVRNEKEDSKKEDSVESHTTSGQMTLTTESDSTRTKKDTHRNVVRIGGGASQRRIAVGIGVRANTQR